MKKYEQPSMDVMKLEAEDVITLSIGDATYDPTIDADKDTSTKNPWEE